MNEQEEYNLKYQIECFESNINPFGHLDVKEAVKIMLAVRMTGDDLGELLREDADRMGEQDYSKHDIVYTALSYVFQMARKEIDEILKIDIENDLSFYVYGNCICSSIDHKTEDLEKLQETYNKASLEDKQLLGDDEFFRYFAEEVNLKTIDTE